MTPFCVAYHALVHTVCLCVDHFSLLLSFEMLLSYFFFSVSFKRVHSFLRLLHACFHYIRWFFSTHILEFRVRWVIHSNYSLLKTQAILCVCVCAQVRTHLSRRKSFFFIFVVFKNPSAKTEEKINDFAHFEAAKRLSKHRMEFVPIQKNE